MTILSLFHYRIESSDESSDSEIEFVSETNVPIKTRTNVSIKTERVSSYYLDIFNSNLSILRCFFTFAAYTHYPNEIVEVRSQPNCGEYQQQTIY